MAKKSRRPPASAAPHPSKPAPRAAARPPSPPAPQTPTSGFPVVGIGASAGGLEALRELFAAMPANTGMAFIVVTHQHPGTPSLLPELLAKETSMPVREAVDGLKVRPNHVYVGAGGGLLAIHDGVLQRLATGADQAPHLPIDFFFRALADDQKEHAICIILSGTGTDGTLGLTAIKGESGMVMVEQPQSAKYAGMPASAIASGLADYVLPPADMPKRLVAYARGPYLSTSPLLRQSPPVPPEPMQRIFALLRGRTGHDFSAYKNNTIRRRVERRMNVHQIKKPNDYVRYLQENPHEVDVLFKELLITVTSFFRDPLAWEALAEPLQRLLLSRPDNVPLRIWVPGCATGEEVFSLAILLRETMDKTKHPCDAQIFGTDLDAAAIETARAGLYPDGIVADVPQKRLDRFFLRADGAFRIRKEIREMTIFALQNVIKDPPFTKLDLISCRNLLIYLNADLQKQLLPIFHYALKPGGLLFLGTSETIGVFSDLFETFDTRWKIFRRKENPGAIHALPEIPAQTAARLDLAALPPAPPKIGHVSTLIERLLLSHFAPASAVVDDRGTICYIHGRTGAYLEPSAGQPRNNILEMAREGLEIELAAALRECRHNHAEVVREGVRIKSNGGFHQVTFTVSRIHEPEALRDLLLVTFRPTPPRLPEPRKKHAAAAPPDAGRVAHLQRELHYLKESHQTTLEELETSNEELKSSNEELQSTNEELQSTNEELETSKEEMQSLNEELTTVNAELQSKVDDLSQANDDMQNLLNSTDIATIFLDNDLNIKRFTDQARQIVMLRPSDVGRPISELAWNLGNKDLAADCREVLKSLAFKESEVQTSLGAYYLMRIMPYRTSENVIEGLVLTFVNITKLRPEKPGT